ncbi:Transposable element Hobo transposase [Folsomia candida]|uniref:Transposable element Hobo transposase n=1 Tax=Folsomia candida TaxID=158441 RepID=A0A226CVP5_FOLCA|nr:Transposable element Hobo transposase [Folsomia candida]
MDRVEHIEDSDQEDDSTTDGSQNASGQEANNGNAAHLSKEDIQRLISQNSSRVEVKEKESRSKAPSAVWSSFKVIYVDGSIVNYVKCLKCCTILKHQALSGTSTLQRHGHVCGAATTSTPKNIKVNTNDSGSLAKFLVKQIPNSQLQDLNDSILVGLARDLRPLGTTERVGFKHIAQSLIDFGAKFGRHDVNDIIRHRTTLKKENLPRVVEQIKSKIKSYLDAAPQNPAFAFTTDMWSDKYTQRHFLSLTIHYINADWKLAHHLLAVDEFPDQRKTADNIREECARIPKEVCERSFFDIDNVSFIMTNSWMVTDGGSNMQKVFENRLACQCHKLNLAIHWLFNDTKAGVDTERGKPNCAKKLFALSTQCPKIKGALHGVKDVVGYFKRAGLNSKLPYSLKQDV